MVGLSKGVQAEVKKQLELYTYRKRHFLERRPEYYFSPREGQVQVENYFHRDPTRLDGECLELSISMQAWFRTTFPDLTVGMYSGLEPVYAHHEKANHVFLVAGSKEDLAVILGGRHKTDRTTWRSALKAATVIDPSFRLLTALDNSGYVVRERSDVTQWEATASSVTIRSGQGLPLGIAPDGTLIGFTPTINGKTLSISGYVKPPKAADRGVHPHSSEFNKLLAGDTELQRVMDACTMADATRVDKFVG